MFARYCGRPAAGVQAVSWRDDSGFADHVLLVRLSDAAHDWLVRADIIVGTNQPSSRQAWEHVNEILAAFPGCIVAAAGWGPGRCVVRVRGGRGQLGWELAWPAEDAAAMAVRYAWRYFPEICLAYFPVDGPKVDDIEVR